MLSLCPRFEGFNRERKQKEQEGADEMSYGHRKATPHNENWCRGIYGLAEKKERKNDEDDCRLLSLLLSLKKGAFRVRS